VQLTQRLVPARIYTVWFRRSLLRLSQQPILTGSFWQVSFQMQNPTPKQDPFDAYISVRNVTSLRPCGQVPEEKIICRFFSPLDTLQKIIHMYWQITDANVDASLSWASCFDCPYIFPPQVTILLLVTLSL
jgi:hypothetical protein